MMTFDEVKDFFIKDRFAMVTTGIEILQADENGVRCSLKTDDRHVNATGHIMGGAIFTLADFTFAIASNLGGVPTVTLSSSITYLSSPKGDTLFSEIKLLKDGRRACFYEISITDNLGNKVASVTSTGMRLAK